MRTVVWMETRSWRFNRQPEMQRSSGGCCWRLQRTHTGAARSYYIIFSITAGSGPVQDLPLTSFHHLLLPSRKLTAVSDLMQSCQTQRVQAECHLSDIKNQVSSVPRLFPWPGLGERRQALEQAQMLLDKTAATGPFLSDVRKQVTCLAQV